MAMIRADRTTDHGVGLTATHHQRCDHRSARAHQITREIRRDAFTLHQLMIEGPIFVVARVAGRIDQLDVATKLDPEVEALDPLLRNVTSGDDDRPSETVVDHLLHGAQHAFVLALAIDDALWILARMLEDWPHQQAGAEDELVETVTIGGEI